VSGVGGFTDVVAAGLEHDTGNEYAMWCHEDCAGSVGLRHAVERNWAAIVDQLLKHGVDSKGGYGSGTAARFSWL
jgi:hypothetical protein